MRTALMAANWKMYKTAGEAATFIKGFKKSLKGLKRDREVLICPPFTALATVGQLIKGTRIKLGAQNFYPQAEGAFTGEISLAMLKNLGVTHIIIGHSERRLFFGETNAGCNAKLLMAFAEGFTPIYCIGESLYQRQRKQTFKVLETQLREGLKGILKKDAPKLVVAYEPIWAIGTGKTATSDIAQEAHAFIRKQLVRRFGKALADQIRIQYGGSVKPGNVDELMAKPDIDGALVGGASLKTDSFTRIAKFVG